MPMFLILAAFFLFLGAFLALRVRVRHPVLLENTRTRTPLRRVSPAWRLTRDSRFGKARGVLRFWVFWEHLTARLWHLRPVPGTSYGLLRLQVTRYHGRPIDLPDGTHIERDDLIAVLHFHNPALMWQASQGPWELLKCLGEEMRGLATWLQSAELPQDIKAVYGLTLLSRVAPRLGFTVRARPRTLMACWSFTTLRAWNALVMAPPIRDIPRKPGSRVRNCFTVMGYNALHIQVLVTAKQHRAGSRCSHRSSTGLPRSSPSKLCAT